MATTVDTLVIELQAETRKLRQGLNKVNRQLDQTKKKSNGATNALKKIGGVLAAIGGVALINGVVQTVRTFEDLEATLRAVTGSAEAAEEGFKLIRAFTATTTFQIEEVAQAFITLKQAGITPTSDALQDFGNFAAGMGKSITQLAQAAFNATTGEMEMLKQFGVVARQQGDEITVTFDGTTKTIERSGESIIAFLRSIGREKFPTAIAERANTLSGAISNLQDQVSEFNVSIGEGGLSDALISLSRNTGALLENLRPLGEAFGMVLGFLTQIFNIGVLVIDTFVLLGRVMADPIKAARELNEAFQDGTFQFDQFRQGMVGSLGDMDEFDKKLEEMLKKTKDFNKELGPQGAKEMKLFEQMRAEIQDTSRSLEELLENDMTALRELLKRRIGLEVSSILKETSGGEIQLSSRFDDLHAIAKDPAFKDFLQFKVGDETIDGVKLLDELLKSITSQVTGGYENLEDFFNFVDKSTKKTFEFDEALEQALTSASLEISATFVQSLRTGEDALKSFRNLALRIVDQIIAAFIQMQVIDPIIQGIFKTGGNDTPTTDGKLLAGGGSMSINQPYIVGERGPELFIPNANGTLLNNMNTKNAMGGGSPIVINQSVNFATGVQATVRNEVLQLMPQIADATKGAITEQMARGGRIKGVLR